MTETWIQPILAALRARKLSDCTAYACADFYASVDAVQVGRRT
jgi:hypothetical protein